MKIFLFFAYLFCSTVLDNKFNYLISKYDLRNKIYYLFSSKKKN